MRVSRRRTRQGLRQHDLLGMRPLLLIVIEPAAGAGDVALSDRGRIPFRRTSCSPPSPSISHKEETQRWAVQAKYSAPGAACHAPGNLEAPGAHEGTCHGSYLHHRQHGRTRPRGGADPHGGRPSGGSARTVAGSRRGGRRSRATVRRRGHRRSPQRRRDQEHRGSGQRNRPNGRDHPQRRRIPERSRGATPEGHATLAVNTLAPYILTALIERSGRLVYLSSGLHHGGDGSLRDLDWDERRWDPARPTPKASCTSPRSLSRSPGAGRRF